MSHMTLEHAGVRKKDPAIHPLIAVATAAMLILALLGHHAYEEAQTALREAEQERDILRTKIAKTRADFEQLTLRLATAEHRTAAAHTRADKLADAMEAMAPRIPGRARAPRLVQESREQ